MPFNPNKTRVWNRSTPADGDLFETEFNRIYENCIDLNDRSNNLLNNFQNLQLGLARGFLYSLSDSRNIIRCKRNSLYEVNSKLIRLNSELTINFSSLTNIFRTDGVTPIAATSETQDKHLYVLLTETGQLHAQIIADSEMQNSSHAFLSNVRLLEDYYTGSLGIWNATKNGYYKNNKRVIGVIRLNSSNQVEFWYELGRGHRFQSVENLSVGELYVELRWKREHPSCYIPDGSIVVNMQTEAPVLFRILNGNQLPNWTNAFLRSVNTSSDRRLLDSVNSEINQVPNANNRHLQVDTFQGHRIQMPYPYLINHNFGPSNLIWANGTWGGWADNTVYFGTVVSDGVNGIPRTSHETRPRNFAGIYQIVRG